MEKSENVKFVKYLYLITLSKQIGDYEDVEELLRRVMETERCKAAASDPAHVLHDACSLFQALIDVVTYVRAPQTAGVFQSLTASQIQSILAKYGSATFVPVCYSVFWLSRAEKMSVSEKTQLVEEINIALDYLDKVEGLLGVSHVQIISKVLQVKLNELSKTRPPSMSHEQYVHEFNSSKAQILKYDQSPETETRLEGLAYTVNININNWREALVCLDKLEKIANDGANKDFPLDQVLSSKAWIFYSFLDQWEESEQKQIIQNA